MFVAAEYSLFLDSMALCGLPAIAQTAVHSDVDLQTAEQPYEKHIADKSLHPQGTFPDGVKGVTYSVTGTGVTPEVPFARQSRIGRLG